MSRTRERVVALLGMLLVATNAFAAEHTLALEIVMNGRPTGRVGEFIDRDGALYATPSELHDLGFALLPAAAAGNDPIPLASLPNVHTQVNEAKQTLIVEASDAALQATELSGGSTIAMAPLSSAGYGAVLNYDVLGTFDSQQNTGGALLDFRAFNPYGVLSSTGLANITPVAGQPSFVRLETTYTYSDPDDLRRWRAGDVVTGALAWSRAVRLGGGQVSSDFGLRPDLITYPLPVISASAAVPSTVDVMVNGIRQFSESVQPGPFAVSTLPVVTGAGDVAVAVQDALGRQTVVTLPFYATTTLLKPGLASYSLETGAVRRNYGLSTDRYSDWAISGSGRYGLTEWLTLESHIEATNALALFGGGAAVQIGTLGVFNAAVSGSTGHGGTTATTDGVASAARRSTGGLVSAGFQRVSRSLSLNLSATLATDDYRDIAAANGSPVPTSAFDASVGYEFGKWGNAGLAYVKQISRTQSLSTVNTETNDSIITNSRVELATASYSLPVGGFASFYATAFKDLRNSTSYGVVFGLSFALGGSASASVGGSVENGRPATAMSVASPALVQGDFGYQLQDQEGASAQRSAQGEYLTRWGRVTAGVDQTAGEVTERTGASGALVLAGGSVFASDTINDSFAVVHAGDGPGVPVLYENRLLGTTDSNGALLAPSLLSYQNNRIAVDATRLPPDIDVGQTAIIVRPPDRSGVVVDFKIRKVHGALLKLQDAGGRPIPLGAVAKVMGEADQPVGYGGEAYVTGLKPANRMEVVLPNGTTCVAKFTYKPVEGDIPVIGPVPCR